MNTRNINDLYENIISNVNHTSLHKLYEQRTKPGTQIYTEDITSYDDISEDEVDIIEHYIKRPLDTQGLYYYEDEANGLLALYFPDVDQTQDDGDWGYGLVDELNNLGDHEWWLGDEEEEYVFIDGDGIF